MDLSDEMLQIEAVRVQQVLHRCIQRPQILFLAMEDADWLEAVPVLHDALSVVDIYQII